MFASARANHHPISKKDMIPTPSHPTKNWKMLLAVTRVSIAIKKMSRYLKNWLMCGSWAIYQLENSRIDHVTKRAIGTKIRE